MIVCESGTVTFSSDLVPPENLVRNDARWRYGNEAADGRVSDPAAARYPVAVHEAARLEAEAAATFLTSDEASYVSGMTLVVDASVTG